MVSLCKLEDFASTFAPYIDELHDFFRSRSVRFGSAEDVAGVAERLSGDDAFRDEMASMIRAIIYRERDGLAPIELFELMVVAVGGPRVEEGSEEIRDSAAQLLAFVRGVCHSRWKTDVDGHGGFETAGEMVDRPSAELHERGGGSGCGPKTAEAGEPRREQGEFETAGPHVEPRAAEEPSAIEDMRHRHNSALFYRARVVAAERHEPQWTVGNGALGEPAAMRWDAAPVEIKPPVELSATKAEAEPPMARVEARPVEVERPVELIATKADAVLGIDRRRPFVKWPTVKLPAVQWPTLSLSWLRRVGFGPRRWMWRGGLCALGVAVGAGLWPHDRAGVVATPARRVARLPRSALAADRKPSPAVKNLRDEDVAAMISAAVQRGRNSGGEQPDELDGVGSSETSAANAGGGEERVRSARPQPLQPQTGQQQEEGRPATSEPSVQPAQPAPAPMAAASGPRPEAPEKTFAGSASRAKGGKYGVPAAVMRGRLLYAPRLQYPMLAKVAHVEGKVVVEAIVGTDGWVTAARVLSGHRLLRGAALSEVRGRHYRPYLLDDSAREVTTTVTVDFRLK